MKRFVTALLLCLASVAAGAQSANFSGINPYNFVGVTGQSTYGFNSESTTGSNASNVYYANFVNVYQGGLWVTDGYFYLGTGGVTGQLTDVIITAATGPNTQASSASCHATWTDDGTTNTFEHVTFSNCMLPGGPYWVGVVSAETAPPLGASSRG